MRTIILSILITAIASAVGLHVLMAHAEDAGAASVASELDAAPAVEPGVPATVEPDAAPAATAPDPVSDPGGFGKLVWSLWRRGLVAPALALTLYALGLVLLWRSSQGDGWLAWFRRGRRLALVAGLVGALGQLAPMAAAGDLTWAALTGAVLSAVALYVRPEPKAEVA